MATNNIKNVLVLGTDLSKTTRFCRMFEAYVLHNSFQEASNWISRYGPSDQDSRCIFLIDNLRFICAPNVKDALHAKHILYTATNLQAEQGLSAILLLVESVEGMNIILKNYKAILFGVFQQLQDSILVVCQSRYSYSHHTNIDKQQISFLNPKKTNLFYIEERTFYEITSEHSWQKGVNFCKTIINGLGENNENFHIDINLSTELLLNLINNLLELLVLSVCVTADDEIYINDFKRNVTVCYNNKCAGQDRVNLSSILALNLKTPRICHAPCKCKTTKATDEVSKCIIFETTNKICMQCKCKAEFHSQNYFKCGRRHSNNGQKSGEKIVLINTLATFYLFKLQHGEVIDVRSIFNNFLMQANPCVSLLFLHAYLFEYDSEVKRLKSEFKTITNKEVIKSLNNLYDIKQNTTVIPKFLEEIFPEDIEITIVTNKSIQWYQPR